MCYLVRLPIVIKGEEAVMTQRARRKFEVPIPPRSDFQDPTKIFEITGHLERLKLQAQFANDNGILLKTSVGAYILETYDTIDEMRAIKLIEDHYQLPVIPLKE